VEQNNLKTKQTATVIALEKTVRSYNGNNALTQSITPQGTFSNIFDAKYARCVSDIVFSLIIIIYTCHLSFISP
jgi:hypothetical protein